VLTIRENGQKRKPGRDGESAFDRPILTQNSRFVRITGSQLRSQEGGHMHQLKPDFAAVLPDNAVDTPELRADKIASAQRQFDSFEPANEAEAALAVFAIVALQGAMDTMEQAAKPGMGAETMARLRAKALSAGRFFSSTLNTMAKRHQQNAKAEAKAKRDPDPSAPDTDTCTSPGPKPPDIPKIALFQPHDRRGKPIPAWRYDLLSNKQRRAAYDYANKAAWDEAMAEEDAAMDEQAELDAQSPPTEEELAKILPLNTDPPPASEKISNSGIE
jgi:hypothetical protein